MRILRFLSFVCLILMPLMAQASPMSFHDEKAKLQQIATENNGGADFWVKLYFPDFTSAVPIGRYVPSYSNGVFEYDDFANYVSEFKITLDGRDETGNQPIDVFIDFDSNHTYTSNYKQIATFTRTDLTREGDSNHFKLVMDVLSGKLLLNTNYGGTPLTTGSER